MKIDKKTPSNEQSIINRNEEILFFFLLLEHSGIVDITTLSE